MTFAYTRRGALRQVLTRSWQERAFSHLWQDAAALPSAGAGWAQRGIDTSGRAAGPPRHICLNHSKKRRADWPDGVDQQRPIEVDVSRLATRLGDQQASVTGRAAKHAVLVGPLGVVIGADGVSGT